MRGSGRLLAAQVGQVKLAKSGVIYDGLHALGNGVTLAGMVLGSIAVFLIDRRFYHAAAFCAAGGVLSIVGLIHGDKVHIFTNPKIALVFRATMLLWGPHADDPRTGAWPLDAPLGAPTAPLIVPRASQLNALTPAARRRLAEASARLEETGAEVVEIDVAAFLEAGLLLYDGALVAERYAAVGRHFEEDHDDADPQAAAIIAEADGGHVGVTLYAPAFHDLVLVDIAARMTAITIPAPAPAGPPAMQLFVVGAHVSGQPLNHDLTDRGGCLLREARTAPGSILGELWALPVAGVGSFARASPGADGTRTRATE